jgi:hypothetical protein
MQEVIHWGLTRYGQDLSDAVATGVGLEDQFFAAVLVARSWWDAELQYGRGWGNPYTDRSMTVGSGEFLPLIMVALMPALIQAQSEGTVRADVNLDQAAEWLARVVHSMAVNAGITFDQLDPRSLAGFVASFAIRGLD